MKPKRITQLFTSTLARGGYSTEPRSPEGQAATTRICQTLLRAAYLGTILGAAVAGARRVLLTLIGGGVFGNPLPLIRESILWAMDEAAPLLGQDLDVVINARESADALGREALEAAVAESGGRWVPV